MRDSLLKLYVKAQVLKQGLKDALNDEQGQDLVEYAAVICLVVLALTGGMSTLAAGINTAMGGVSTKVSKLLS
jgi:Flp pilus assembly pilin Flp